MQLIVPRVVKTWAKTRQIIPAEIGFADNGFGRKFAREDTDPNWADAFLEFNLTPVCIEPEYKIFTGVHFYEGAFTHIHRDDAPNNFVHARCNVMLRKPAIGGNPIIDDEIIDVNEGDLWLVLASMEDHGSVPIGGTRRVIKSFGGLVPLEQVTRIINTEKNKCANK